MDSKVPLSSLKPVSILFYGDFYDLADLMLKMSEVRYRGTNIRSRSSVHGVAAAYSWLMIDVDTDYIEDVVRRHGLDLEAIVERENDIP